MMRTNLHADHEMSQHGPCHSFSKHNVTWQTCGHEHNNVTILNSLYMVNNDACIGNLFNVLNKLLKMHDINVRSELSKT